MNKARNSSKTQTRQVLGLWVLLGLFVQILLTPVHATAPLVHETKMAEDPAYAAYYSLCDQSQQNKLKSGSDLQAAASCAGCCPSNFQGLNCCAANPAITLVGWSITQQRPMPAALFRTLPDDGPHSSRAPPFFS